MQPIGKVFSMLNLNDLILGSLVILSLYTLVVQLFSVQ